MDEPRREVPHIDELDGVIRCAWDEDIPPLSNRTGQYVNRSVGSPGPTMKPGRTLQTRPGMASSTVRSHSALRAP